MAWGMIMVACYFLGAMGLLIVGLGTDARCVPAERIDARDLPAEIPEVKKAA